MKPKVLLYNQIPLALTEKLKKFANVIQISPANADFILHLTSATGIIGSRLKVDKTLLKNAPSLKIISNISAGYDNLDIDELTKRGIMATNTPGVLTDTTADTILSLLLSTAKRIPELDHFVKTGKWNKTKIPEDLFGVDIYNKTLGIIGMGKIGKAVAERAHYGFKMKILYHSRTKKKCVEKELNAQYQDLQDLLRISDFVCLLAPLTPDTANLIGKRELQIMKKSAIFINGSRGELVQEKELINALENKEILRAGLDVYRKEPLDHNSPFLRMKNVVTLPHIGSATLETRNKMAVQAVENLIEGLNNKIPPNLINDAVFNTNHNNINL